MSTWFGVVDGDTDGMVTDIRLPRNRLTGNDEAAEAKAAASGG